MEHILRINKKYGKWFYKKEKEYDMEFPVYYVYGADSDGIKDSWSSPSFEEIRCFCRLNKDDREEYKRIYG